MKQLALLMAALFVGTVHAQPANFQEGVHYQVIQPAQPTNDASKIEVVEIFNYACPACAGFQQFIDPWSNALSDEVSFARIPVVFQSSWEPFARAYYTAEALGVIEQSHQSLFKALHEERQALRSPDDLAKYFAQFGVSEDDYLKTSRSFSVETKMRRGSTLAQRYGVSSTPSVVVNGKYITGGRMAGSYPRMIEVVDFLIASEAAALSTSETTTDAKDEAADSGD